LISLTILQTTYVLFIFFFFLVSKVRAIVIKHAALTDGHYLFLFQFLLDSFDYWISGNGLRR